MSNAFDAIVNDDSLSTSSQFLEIEKFKKETSNKLNEVSYNEIFNIQKSLNPQGSIIDKFKLDSAQRKDFSILSKDIAQSFANKMMDVSKDVALSDGEKKFEIQSLMNDMIGSLNSEAKNMMSNILENSTATLDSTGAGIGISATEQIHDMATDHALRAYDSAQNTFGSYSENPTKLATDLNPLSKKQNLESAQDAVQGSLDRAYEEDRLMSENYTAEHVLDTVDEVTNNMVTDLSHIAVTEVMGSIANSDITAYTVNPALLAKDITESFNDSALNLVSSIKEGIVDNALGIGDGLVDAAKIGVSSLLRAPLDLAKNAVNEVTGKLSSLKDDLVHDLSAKMMSLRNVKDSVNKGASKLVDMVNPPTVTGTEVFYDTVTVKPVARSQFRVVDAQTANIRSLSVVTESLYMSLDNFWDINVVTPTKQMALGMPSLRVYFGLSEAESYYHLPITSFTFNGESVANIEHEMYPGLNLPIPSMFQRPNKLSFQIPELIHRKFGKAETCLLAFKQAFMNYVMVGDKGDYIFRDVRDCAYLIEIRKFSPRWELVQSWGFFGVPEVSVSEAGSSSATVEFGELSFNLIGEFEVTTYVDVHEDIR